MSSIASGCVRMPHGSLSRMWTGVTLAALVVAAWWSPRAGRAGAVTLAAVSVLWLLVNDPMEGPVLLTVAEDHGLTAADLAGLAGLLIAAWELWWSHRHRVGPPHR